MQDILIVVDMQNDFIDGALGTKEAVDIVPKVVDKVKSFKGKVIFTRDTHGEDYLSTLEGRNLPVKHCVKGTEGWEICDSLKGFATDMVIDKPTFGSTELGNILLNLNEKEEISSITLVGLCTDICVISNAMIAKSVLYEIPVIVDASCCAGVTIQSHINALEAMKMCQIQVVNR